MDTKGECVVSNIVDIVFSIDFFYSVLRVTTPILFATMGAVIASRGGIPNIALEGTMLIASFVAVAVSAMTQSATIGLLGALLSGVIVTGVLAFFTLYYKTNVILGGIAVNTFASGATVFALYLMTGDKGTSASMKSMSIPNVEIPLIKDIPVLGDILSGHNLLTYFAFLSIFVVYILINKTSFGYHLRAVGEDENAAKSVGISINKVKTQALLLSGLFCGFGGAFMSMGYVSWFAREMISGRGWIALAAEAMGKANPVTSAVTAVIFGASDAFANSVGSLGWPSDLVKTIPYCVTLIGLFIFAVRTMKKSKKS